MVGVYCVIGGGVPADGQPAQSTTAPSTSSAPTAAPNPFAELFSGLVGASMNSRGAGGSGSGAAPSGAAGAGSIPHFPVPLAGLNAAPGSADNALVHIMQEMTSQLFSSQPSSQGNGGSISDFLTNLGQEYNVASGESKKVLENFSSLHFMYIAWSLAY